MSATVFSSETKVDLPPIGYMFVSSPFWMKFVQFITVVAFFIFLVSALVHQAVPYVGLALTVCLVFMIVSHYARRNKTISEIVAQMQFREQWVKEDSYLQLVNFLTLVGLDEETAKEAAVELALPAIVGLEKVIDFNLSSTDIVSGEKVDIVVRLRPTMRNYEILQVEAFMVYPEMSFKSE